MDNNLYLYCGLSSHKIGDCNKHQTLLFSSNIKAKKDKIAFSEKFKN